MFSKYTYIEGTALNYFYSGPSTLPDRPPCFDRGLPLLLLHGEGGNAHMWHRQISSLGETHSVVALDFPGHGRSGSTEGLASIADYAGLTAAFLDKLGLDSYVLAGHSLGAAVAMSLAHQHPERVRALVLSAAAVRLEFSPQLIETWRNVSLGRTPQPFTLEPFSPKAEMSVIRETFMEHVKTDPRVRYTDLLACNAFDASAIVPSIGCPTLVVAGRDDQLVPLAASESLSASLSQATTHVIENAGHSAMLEQPDAMSTAISDFLGTLV